jgi:hypothetical protein
VSGTVDALSLPPERAIAFFRQKVNVPTRAWDDLRHGAHARAWSVAGVQSHDMLAEIRGAMDKAIAQGTTLDEFRRDIGGLLADLGWADRGPGYVAWRTRTVFETNMRTAYAAGRYAQLTDPDVLAARPYWRYRHSKKKKFRQEHKDWDGLVLPATHEFWQTHFPPNGWGCGCYVQSVGERARAAAAAEKKDRAPRTKTRPYRDPVTDEARDLPVGIDPGWDYSVGRSWLHGTVPPELAEPLRSYPGNLVKPTNQRPADLPPLPPARPPRVPELLPEGQDPDFYVDAFLQEFGATRDRGVAFRDASGARIVISRDLFFGTGGARKADAVARGRFMLLLAEALRSPDEIWADWAQSHAGGIHIRRRYLRRFVGAAGALAVFEWTPVGWFGATMLVARAAQYLERQRSGVLLYRRADDDEEK